MKQNVWCRLFNLHKYEVIKEEQLIDTKGNVVGLVIVSRCSNCGKIKQTTIYTEYNGRL